MLSADLVLQVKFFLSQFVCLFDDLTIGERVLDANSDLVGDMLQQFGIVLRKDLFLQARHRQSAERAAVSDQWQVEGRFETLRENSLGKIGTELFDVMGGYKDRLARDQGPSGRRSLHRNRQA